MKKKLYIDLDDTFVDTENYLRAMFKQNDIHVPESKTIYTLIGTGEYDFLFKEGMSDYTLIPRMPGAEDAIRILSTEYDISFLSCCVFDEEAVGKKKLAKAFRKELILCDSTKSHINMENAVFIDDNVGHLIDSNSKDEDKFLFFNLYTLKDMLGSNKSYFGHVVSDWYEITNILMGVTESDAKLREYFRERIQKCGARGRV